MADGFLIGSAYVQVKPDTSTFKADLDAGLAGANATATVKVSPDATGFSEKLKAAVAAAGSDTATVRITADTSGLDAGVAGADAKLDEVGARTADPKLGLDSAAFASAVQAAMAQLDEAGARSVSARLTLDDTGFKAQLDSDMAELAAAGSAGAGGIGLIGAAIGGATLAAPALPAALAGAGGAVGTLTLAFAGINSALTAYSAQAAQAAKATQGMGGAASSSSAAVRSAQQAVSAAETQQAHDAITSAESVSNAQAGVAQAVQQAAQSQVAAEQQVATAQYNEQQAQEALTAARAAAVLQIQALDNAEADTALSAQQAQLDLEQAQLNQQTTDASATATALQKAQAELSVEEAEQRLKESLQARTNAASAANTADKEGVNGAPGVVAAKHNVATAEQAQAAAAANLATVEQAGAASIAKAQQSLADAERNSSWQRAADAQRVQQAQQSLAGAYASAAGGSAAATTAGNAYAAAMGRLSPASQQVVKDILSLKAAVSGLESISANSIAPGLATFLGGIQSLLPEVRTELEAMGGIISTGLADAGRAMESSGFQKDLAALFDEGNRFITVLGPAVGNLGSAFVDLGVRSAPAVSGLASGLAGLLGGVSDLLRGLAPFSAQAGIILQVLGQAAGLLGGPMAQAVGILETAIAPLVQAALPAFASLAGAVSRALTTLQPVVTQLAGEVGTVLAPSLAAIASVLGAGLDGVITGVADALTGLMNAIGPTATGGVVLGITAIVLGMKAWAAATAAVAGEGLIGTVAGWVTGLAGVATASTAAAGAQKLLAASAADVLFTTGNFAVTAAGEVVATEAATVAMGELTVAETAAAVAGGILEAINPLVWVAAAAVAVAGLTAVLLTGGDAVSQYAAQQKAATDATGYNIAGYQKLGEQLDTTGANQARLNSVIQAGVSPVVSMHDGINEYAQGVIQMNTQSDAAFTKADKLNDAMRGLGTTYGISETGAIAVAKAAGIQASSWTGSAAALDKANAKFAAYIISNQNALAPTQEINALMSIFGSNATTAANQTAALNTAWQILVGNFVSKQQAMLNASTAVQQYSTAAKQAGGNTQALQLQFYSTITSLQPLIDQISKTHAPMGTLYQDLQNQIQALQNSGPLNAAEQQALQRLQQLADNLANSTHGMTTAQQTAATVMEGLLIPQLTDLGVKTSTAQTDSKNLADAILNTGSQSKATSADRAALIADLEKAGVNAQTATTLVDAFIKKVATIQASKTTDIIVHGDGTYTINGSSIKAAAAGLFVQDGRPGVDDQLIVAQKDELIVPPPIVHAGLVDHLRGMIPGFGAGGVVGSYNGSVGGEGPWVQTEYNATELTIEKAVAAAAAAAIKAAQAAAANAAGAAGPGGGAPAANAALAKKLMPAWASGAEWTAWNAVAMRESGWNQFARNPASGAYGIPQALPPSKMGAAANPPDSNPTAQINWMINYIKTRPGYGDPIGAEAHEQAFGWYDNGGWLMPGQTVATNNTGQPERVVSPAQEKAAGGGPRVVNHNTFAYYGPQQPTPEMQQAMLVNLASMVGAAG